MCYFYRYLGKNILNSGITKKFQLSNLFCVLQNVGHTYLERVADDDNLCPDEEYLDEALLEEAEVATADDPSDVVMKEDKDEDDSSNEIEGTRHLLTYLLIAKIFRSQLRIKNKGLLRFVCIYNRRY